MINIFKSETVVPDISPTGTESAVKDGLICLVDVSGNGFGQSCIKRSRKIKKACTTLSMPYRPGRGFWSGKMDAI
jgi:hypothetical protein